MKFTHGSSKDIRETEAQALDVFDYNIDSNGNISLSEIDNGNDGEGIGIYAFIGHSEEDIKNASCYTSEESGFVYLLNVDVEEEELMHNRDPDEIPTEELAEAIEDVLNEIRRINNCDKDTFDRIINAYEDHFEDLTLKEVNERLDSYELEIKLDEYSDPQDFNDFYEWQSQVEEHYNLSEPCSKIHDEGGSYGVASSAIEQSYNLWDTITYIGRSIAIMYSNKGTEKYNKTFQQTMCNSLADYRLIATYADEGNFAVIFDTDEIEIEDIINVNEKLKVNKKKKNTRRKHRI